MLCGVCPRFWEIGSHRLTPPLNHLLVVLPIDISSYVVIPNSFIVVSDIFLSIGIFRLELHFFSSCVHARICMCASVVHVIYLFFIYLISERSGDVGYQ